MASGRITFVAQDPAKRPADSGGSAAQPAEGLSQFMAKVLDQLSVAAWLPAFMLVGNVAVLFNYTAKGARTLDALLARWWTVRSAS